ncbi:MAG TPA: Re/Si-specific NAD(P)(+) transhydrogenase subunit alpha [Gemmatimonadales bacterium]|nr:Re/Si-specific NAD(P)(+) transhydrogenase subunit alpha [Gemmatimonadales bacterium]
MRIGVFKENAPREHRVALTPDGVARLVKAGDTVVVERGAGAAAFFADDAYVAAGATLGDASSVGAADLVCKVQRPAPDEIASLRDGVTLISFAGADAGPVLDQLRARHITLLALERVPRTTRAQAMDVLSSQATVAGYKAALIGAEALSRFLPMLTTAAGSLTPARVLVIGAGVAGLQAIATTRRLGGVVAGFDVRPAAAEEVLSIGAKFLAPEAISADAATAGGYARELAEEQQRKVLAVIDGAVAQTDLVISTAAIPGKPAPRLITTATVEKMHPGSVIVDVAAETGGNCELTRAGETVVHHGVTIIGPLNLPSTMPMHASQMFSRNVQTLIGLLRKDGQLVVDLNDDIVKAMSVVQ